MTLFGGARLIWKIFTATVMTTLVGAVNFFIGDIWVREGLYADAHGSADPMQPQEIIIFAISGAMTIAIPAYTAAWLANFPRRSKPTSPVETEPPLSTWMAIRVGKNPPLTAAVLTGCVALAILVYGPGVASILFG